MNIDVVSRARNKIHGENYGIRISKFQSVMEIIATARRTPGVCHDWASSLLSSARSRLVSSLLLSLALSLSRPSRRVRNSAESSWQCYLCILSSAPLPNWPSVQMRAKTILPVSQGPDHVIPDSFPLQICTFFPCLSDVKSCLSFCHRDERIRTGG